CLRPEDVFEEGGRVALIGTGLIVWFWWTLVWLFWGAVLLVRFLTPRDRAGRRWLVRGLATLLGALAAVGYLSSWALYFRSGRFSTIEALLFGWENAQTTWFWHYLLEAEGPCV